MNKNILIGGGVLAVVVLAVAVGTSSGGGGDVDASAAFGEVTIDGTPLPRLQDPANDSAIGAPAPVAQGVDLDGDPIAIGSPEQPTILLFLAHWCSHCQAEVARLTPWLAENELDGVDFKAIATSSAADQPNWPPNEWLEREEWPVPTMLDDEGASTGTAYGLSAFPFWVVLDADGVVQARFTGELSEEQFEAIAEQTAALEG